MSKTLVVFEDQGYTNLLPLTHTRPACCLRCGVVTLLEKIEAAYRNAQIVIHAREYLRPVLAEEDANASVNRFEGEGALLINGRLIAPANLARVISPDGEDCVYLSGGQLVAARTSGAKWSEVARLLAAGPLAGDWIEGMVTREVELPLLRYPWDLFSHNGPQIAADFERLQVGGGILGQVHPSAILDDRDRIHVGEGAQIQAGAVLLAHEGPIFIGPGAKVMAGAVLEGPVAVGAKSSIKMQAKIYEGTSLGPYCKVGGEVEESIFQAYSNKQHDGFLGHAVLGEWINLGADTNNSDLKNNYSTVKVTINGAQVDSGSLFVGTIMGDHSKCGINTMLNTGTVVGVACNVYGADFPPKYVPSFCWGGAGGFVEHQLAKFLTTAERVMARRDRMLTDAGRSMLEAVFKATAGERAALVT